MMESFLKIAINQARNSDAAHKHGSVLICKNQIFTGYNHFTGCSTTSMTIHAEEHAITNFINWCRLRRCSDTYIRRKIRKSTLLTVRVKDESVKYSPPCGTCVKMIQKYEIKHVVYSEQQCETSSTINISVKKTRDLPPTKPSSGYRRLERIRLNIEEPTSNN